MKLKSILTRAYIIILSMVAFVIILPVRISSRENGSTAGEVLLMGAGARATALGGAYTAMGDEFFSTYWNPAGLVEGARNSVAFEHNHYLQGIKYNLGGLSYVSEKRKAWAGSVFILDYGGIEGRDVNGNLTGEYIAQDMIISISHAQTLGERFAVGITGRFIDFMLENARAAGGVFDIGAKYKFKNMKGVIGLTIRNLGWNISFGEKKEKLPVLVSGGAGLYFNDMKGVAEVDFVKMIDGSVYVNTGIEYNLVPNLHLRGGYTTMNDAGEGFSAGFGLEYHDIVIDYSFTPYKHLGDSHRFSLTYNF